MHTRLSHLTVTNDFAQLPSNFYIQLQADGLRDASLLHVNEALGACLGLSPQLLHSPEFLQVVSGNAPLPNGKTLAAVYSGHQFGVWAGQLGDGRAHLLGAIDTPNGPQELQLKGSGLTPYSRRGDGRAVLRSSVREYLASEAMYGLGIPTTRALALVTSPVPVRRERIETAAIVTRVSPSFVRFGSFEHWLNQPEEMSRLLRYTVEHFFPELHQQQLNDAELSIALLQEVSERTARLMADWLLVGFCHGVMNTDNMSILGLTIDYGPYGFMDAFHAGHICNTTDERGRYAWNNQPSIGHWNLFRLASSFTTLGAKPDQLKAALDSYEPTFLAQYHRTLCEKFGWQSWQEGDNEIVDAWWKLLHNHAADFTLTFRSLAYASTEPQRFLAHFSQPEHAQAWLDRYRQRMQQENTSVVQQQTQMLAANPLYILRNHLAQKAIDAAEQGDKSVISDLLHVLAQPYVEHAGFEQYAQAPAAGARSQALSCSS